MSLASLPEWLETKYILLMSDNHGKLPKVHELVEDNGQPS